jgi:thiamine biosynthesis lipoprotein
MGTTFSVTVYGSSAEEGVSKIEEIVRIVEDAENQMSTWIDQSEVSQLNRKPIHTAIQLSPSLCEVMKKNEQWVNFTGGAFDPGCGKIVEAWQIHGRGRIPDKTTIQYAVQNSGFSKLQFHQCTITKSADVSIDVGAFGKGEALDRILKLAEQKNFPPMLIDFGGQIVVWKNEPAKNGWNVNLANPIDRQTLSGVSFFLRYGSLSTSGGSERDLVVRGKHVSHIVDPHTGLPVSSFGSVTVWSKDAFSADALSTALYVMGPEKGYRWAIKNRIAACFLIKDGAHFNVKKTLEFETAGAHN